MGVPVSLVPRGGIASCWPKVRWNLSIMRSLLGRMGVVCVSCMPSRSHMVANTGTQKFLITMFALWPSQASEHSPHQGI